MVGPIMGSMIYANVGYENTFFIFSGLLLLSCIFVFFILPARLNKLETDAQLEGEDQEKNSQRLPAKEITFSMFLFNARAMLAVVSSTIAMVFMLFYNGILSVELTTHMGVDGDNVGKHTSLLILSTGYIFALGALMYALSSPLVSIVFRGLPRRYITQIAFIVSSVALFLFGPSELLNLPE